MSWQQWEFWLFSAVGSFVLVPILEELFFRGYCQRRLAEEWGDGPAILGAACLFTLQHAQYHAPNLYNAGMVVGLLVSAIGFGAVFAWTRSMIPAMIAHAIFDIPMTPVWAGVVFLIMLAGAAVKRKKAVEILKGIVYGERPGTVAMLALLGGVGRCSGRGSGDWDGWPRGWSAPGYYSTRSGGSGRVRPRMLGGRVDM
jgi:hypothetical protein